MTPGCLVRVHIFVCRHDLSDYRNGDFLGGLSADVQADGTNDLRKKG